MMLRLALLLPLLGACAAAPRARLYVFLTTDCPIANSFAPEIKRIAADYGPHGVDVTLCYTDLTHSLEDARKHAAEFGYRSELLRDENHALAKKFGVQVTPEAVLLDAAGARRYRGRIDDRYLAPGKYRLAPTTRELRDALDAVLDGRPVAVAETAAAGCPLTE